MIKIQKSSFFRGVLFHSPFSFYFIMLFRDMPDQSSDEVHYREGFLHILAIFMAVVMESDKIAVIPVDS